MQRKSNLHRHKGLNRTGGPGKKRATNPGSVSSKDTSANTKKRIQQLLRQIVIARDGGCLLAGSDNLECGPYRTDGAVILQADHLVTRRNSATYADPRLVVCLCQRHHAKKSPPAPNHQINEVNQIIAERLEPWRVELWERAENETWHSTRYTLHDWQQEEMALKQQLDQYDERV